MKMLLETYRSNFMFTLLFFGFIEHLIGGILADSEGQLSPRIQGGQDVAEGEFLSAMALDACGLFCTFFIISAKTALGAAHCVVRRELSCMEGRIGKVNRRKGKKVTFDKYYVHEGYDIIEQQYDIASLVFSEKIKLSDKIQPIALSAAGRTFTGAKVMAYGWGRFLDTDGNYGFPDVLQKAELEVLKECSVPEKWICARRENNYVIRTTEGDSGGPLVYNDNGTPIAIGVLGGFAGSSGSVYMSISYFSDWIDKYSVGDVKFV